MSRLKLSKTTTGNPAAGKAPQDTISNIYHVISIWECKRKLRQVSMGFWGSRLVNGLSIEERADYALFLEMLHDLLDATSAMDVLGAVQQKRG